MKLTHFAFDTPFEWSGHNVCSLVIENPQFYRNAIRGLIEQSQIGMGDFVFSNENAAIPFDKNVEIISDVFSVDASSNKTIVSAIIKEAMEFATHQLPQKLSELYMHINDVMSDLCFNSTVDLTFDEINDVGALLKTYHLRPDTENLSFAEKLISYMELCQKFAKKRLFIAINLRACFSDSEAQNFYNDVIYRKLNLLSIDCINSKKLDCEQRKIIDIDMCEL